MRFVWDEAKARRNEARHGVAFVEATAAVLDPIALVDPDSEHADRLVVIGMSSAARVLFVVVAEVQGDVIRIISARKASPTQRKRYAQNR